MQQPSQPQQPPRSRAVESFLYLLAGAGSGAVTKTAVAPLERIKLLLQVQATFEGPARYGKFVPSAKLIYKEEGLLGFYKGNYANILRIVPVYALKFAFNDTYKKMVLKPGQKASEMGFSQLLAVGWIAGLSQSVITYPLEVVRTRASLDLVMNKGTFNGIVHCAKQTVRHEGIMGLYRGVAMTFISTPVYVGLQMTLYEIFRRKLSDENGKTSVANSFVAGGFAGLIAQTTAYPGDTIKKQLQADGFSKTSKGDRITKYKGIIDCTKKIIALQGIRGLYAGLALNSLKCLPEAGIQFVCYDAIKAFFHL